MKKLIVLFLLAGCAHLKPIETDLKQCADGVVPSALNDLFSQASASLLGAPDSTDWKSFAETDLMKYGLDAAACVVMAVLHEANLGMAHHGQMNPRYLRANELGRAWLAKHHHAE